MQTADQTKEPLIELTQADIASARDSSARQIEGVNWRLMAGDYWVVAGAHGSGKSDLIATAAGLQRPLGGSVKLFGTDISELSEADLLELRSQIGVVFKNGGRMFAQLTVEENIALPLRYRFDWTPAQAAAPVEELLRLAGLTEYAHNTAGMLGSSWMQRVGLARALALKPAVLFLDEPLAGLEVRHRRWWQDFLLQISTGTPFTNGQPVALAIVTNDLELWSKQGRQFAQIHENRWQELGDCNAVQNLISHEKE